MIFTLHTLGHMKCHICQRYVRPPMAILYISCSHISYFFLKIKTLGNNSKTPGYQVKLLQILIQPRSSSQTHRGYRIQDHILLSSMGIIYSKFITYIHDHFILNKIHQYIVTLQLGSHHLATVAQTSNTFSEFFPF